MPVFHSSDLIPYETRVLDPEGMLPEVAGEGGDGPGGNGRGGDDGDDPGGCSGGGGQGAVVGGAESDELEAKTQENPHPHLMRMQERKK